MRKYILIWIFFCGCLCMNAQVFDMLNSDLYRGRVKLVSEFMKRFNGEEKNHILIQLPQRLTKSIFVGYLMLILY